MKELRQLDQRQQCREKLPVWFGSRSNYYHGLLEVMMNGNDEMITHPQGKFQLDIELFPDNKTVSVRDYGRGINLTEDHNGIPVYELLFETLFAGTNFDNADSGKETTGTNGCGLTVLNYTSIFFNVTTINNSQKYGIEYSSGGRNRNITPKQNIDNPTESGTKVVFTLDPEMYTQTEYNIETIKSMCMRLAAISNGLLINLKYNNEVFSYQYNNIIDYMEQSCDTIIGQQYEFDEQTKSCEIKIEYEALNDETLNELNDTKSNENNRIKLVWSIGTDPFQETYLNCTYLKENGHIYDGVIDGFKKIMDKYAGNKTKIVAADIELGLNFVCGLWTNNVEFANQTKFSTKKNSYKQHVSQYVVDNLEAFRLEHEKEFNTILKHFIEINNFNKKAEDEIKSLKNKIQKKGKGGISPKIDGLIDCDMHKSELEERILIIDEGLSANSTIIQSRDDRYMGCIGLRGRFINSYKTSVANVFKNEPAVAIMSALGCGIELPEKDKKRLKDAVKFEKENLRYGRIAIICDADSFGKAITLSLLCYFHKFYPTLCEEGRIYVVSSPRFVLYDKKGNAYYVYNEAEKSEKVAELGKELDHIGIVKGLGELNKEEFWEYVLSPKAREKTFTQVDFSGNEEDIERMFEVTMGDKIDERKKFIIDNVVN